MKEAIIDLGARDLKSIFNFFHRNFNCEINIYKSPNKNIIKSDVLVIPGVGNFGHAANNLFKNNFMECVNKFISCGKLIFGICLGAKLLTESSEEVKKISDIYGKQAVIVSINFLRNKSNELISFDWVKKLNRDTLLPHNFSSIIPNIGEILFQDVEKDGRVLSANLDSIKEVCKLLPKSLPIHIGSCRLVSWEQYSQLLDFLSIDALSVFNVHQISIKAIKALRKNCFTNNIKIRDLENINI